jgi:hypothetical protein
MGLTEPSQKNLARRQDGPGFSKYHFRQDGYVILMDGLGHGNDILPTYPAHYHL